MLRALLAITGAALATACASQRFEGPDGDRRFYEARCGVCHVPYPRDEHTAEEWSDIVAEMAPRASLTRSQRERVLRYLSGR
jgi:hypothetical protein